MIQTDKDPNGKNTKLFCCNFVNFLLTSFVNFVFNFRF